MWGLQAVGEAQQTIDMQSLELRDKPGPEFSDETTSIQVWLELWVLLVYGCLEG